ncbi:hypothetical protein AA0119_g3621 [Alternaria tenuissima]|uniref:Uncharacterized protein n=3 Tax=Alternaria alternata complex TaxID=187734 RepID=A0A4Q4NT55_ALTAL|nr:hypothetical protein AA0117_g2660 [Alternaria alternata]RYO05147.1 hypothetical protein AA0119_g3621 [Alternaria tenuissima]RYO16886.1 hypothetical protein AA0121_g6155 [Alternaria tenuissima]RYO69073.1 hypothetical protein AA0116_g785 [Alternaria tenuissima]
MSLFAGTMVGIGFDGEVALMAMVINLRPWDIPFTTPTTQTTCFGKINYVFWPPHST